MASKKKVCKKKAVGKPKPLTAWQSLLKWVSAHKGQEFCRMDLVEEVCLGSELDPSASTIEGYVGLLVKHGYLKVTDQGRFHMRVKKAIPKAGLSLRELKGELKSQKDSKSDWQGMPVFY